MGEQVERWWMMCSGTLTEVMPVEDHQRIRAVDKLAVGDLRIELDLAESARKRVEAKLEQVAQELERRAEGYAEETGIPSAYRDAAQLLRDTTEGERAGRRTAGSEPGNLSETALASQTQQVDEPEGERA
jgi:hypothetical protein